MVETRMRSSGLDSGLGHHDGRGAPEATPGLTAEGRPALDRSSGE